MRKWKERPKWPKEKSDKVTHKKKKKNDIQNNTRKTKDRATRTPLKTEGELTF